ncbi:hypothetical protein VTL71DRAFT_2289 [Oculimacula yallundae]|uniref:Ubiquitin-conjugating enzyme E2-binding protein n=1 Tax=Oculimacula yallundae TaxID=86028 RepID=A0ABR4CAQ9_9HELO
MSSSPKPLMYAELLSNIRQISVLVALDTPCGPGTNAQLSADGRQFILQHEGDTFILNLPGQAVSNFPLQKPVLGNKDFSWRIPVAGEATRASIEDAQSNEAPWSAKDLSEDAEFACRNCGTAILEKGTIKEWRDLPSENWAEMMEFWHCHKPDVPPEEESGSSGQNGHVHPEETAASKGYGATSKFTARTGIGFIDLTTFLLDNSDCTNIKLIERTDDRPASIFCTHCHHNLGVEDLQPHGFRLYKWSLTLLSSQLQSIQSPTLSSLISSKCLASIKANCVGKLVLEPRAVLAESTSTITPTPSAVSSSASSSSSTTPPPLTASQYMANSLPMQSCWFLLWVLQPSLFYSIGRCANGPNTPMSTLGSPNHAMKVFWRPISVDEAKTLLDAETADELVLPEDIVVKIEGILRDSALCLPPSARKFQDWDVGLLERYQPIK